jgi:Flp pilus assembly protein TadD
LIAGNMPEDGLLVLRRARAIDPRHVPILCALGLAYLRLGLRREAEEAVAAAVALAPGSADVLHCQAKLAYAHA